MAIGRPKGAKNKFPADAKENVIAVFTRLGGTAAMARWAMRHPSEFYRIYAKLVPQEQETHHSGDINYTIATGVPEPDKVDVTEMVDGLARAAGARRDN